MQDVTLRTLRDLNSLDGEAAEILQGPTLRNQQLVGFRPQIRVAKGARGVWLPMDTFSVELLSLYSSFESLKEMDARMGWQNLLPWPRRVGVDARIGSDGDIWSYQVDNALYVGELDSYLFVPYKREELPLIANAAVIGHEHFHAHFFRIVLAPLIRNPPEVMRRQDAEPGLPSRLRPPQSGASVVEASRLQAKKWILVLSPHSSRLSVDDKEPTAADLAYFMTVVRGVNEGLADVWGWAFTGDLRFVSRSIPERIDRNLTRSGKLSANLVKELRVLSSQSNKVEEVVGLAYLYGTQIATAIVSQAKLWATEGKVTSDADARDRVAKAITRVLAGMAKDLQTKGEKIEPDQILRLLSREEPLFDFSDWLLPESSNIREGETREGESGGSINQRSPNGETSRGKTAAARQPASLSARTTSWGGGAHLLTRHQVERASGVGTVDRPSQGIGIFGEYESFQLGLDYLRGNERTGNSSLSIGRSREEWSVQSRWWAPVGSGGWSSKGTSGGGPTRRFAWGPHLAVSTGWLRENITMRVEEDSSVEAGEWYSHSTGGVGVQFRWLGLFLLTEVRLGVSEVSSLNGRPDFLAALGFRLL